MSESQSAYTKRLDRSKPHGSVHPPYNGVYFEQNGYHFDNDGFIVEGSLTDEQKKALKKAGAPAAKPVRAVETDAPPPPPPVEEDDAPEADEDGPNLELWLRGEAVYPIQEVQKAVKARMSRWFTKKAELVEFLVDDQKIVTFDQLSDDFKKLLKGA